MAKKEETQNHGSLTGSGDSGFRAGGFSRFASRGVVLTSASEYITSLAGLQETICGKFTPKRKRAETVAGLYQALARRVEDMGPECVEAYLQMEGEKGFDRVWYWMHLMSGEEILHWVQAWLLRFYSGHGYKVDDCGTFLQYRVTPEAASLVHANFCRDRMCPLCNWRRSLKVFGQVSKIMTELDKGGYRYLFLTLTIRNVWGDELPAAIQALYDGWRVLYHDYIRGSGHSAEKRLKGVIAGTFRALEVTVSDGRYHPEWAGSFHPHLHVILAAEKSYFQRGHYLTTGDWQEIWRNACNLNYNPSIKIEAVRPKECAGPFDVPTEAGKPLDYAGAVAELSKYPLKDADFVGADADYHQQEGQYMDWLLKALRRRRLIGLTGCFRDVARALALDDMETGDLVDVNGAEGEEQELRDDVNYLMVNYHWRCGAYVPSVFEPDGDNSAFRDDTYRLTPEDLTPEAAEARKKRRKRKPDAVSPAYDKEESTPVDTDVPEKADAPGRAAADIR